MAHVVPKREPCVKCRNPVFLAERLQINKSLYHRTCFRCARCDSILTLGNFYETEKDHEYCCETCPDEEKTTPKVEESNRLSIAQKIALFEKETSNVLKKSLSDEEKSKSLSRQPTANSQALNSFLTQQIDPVVSDEDEKTIDSLSSESESDNEETAPPLPSNRPSNDDIPPISDKQLTISDHKVISESPDNFVVTKELKRDEDIKAIASVAENNSESHDSAPVVVRRTDKQVSETSCDDDFESLFEQIAEDAVNSVTVPIPISVKKKPAVVAIPEVAVAAPVSSDKTKNEEVSADSAPGDALLIKQRTQIPDEIEKSTDEVSENVSVGSVSSFEPIVQSDHPTIVIQPETPEAPSSANPEFAMQSAYLVADDESNGSNEKAEEENIIAIPTSTNPDDPSKSCEAISSENKIGDGANREEKNPFDDADKEEPVDVSSKDEQKILIAEPAKRPSLNPFGSCSEDEDESQNASVPSVRYSGTLPKPPRPPPPKTVKPNSTNPFGSDDEDEHEKPSTVLRTPVPTPRRPLLHSTTPEPSPRSISNHNSPGHSFKGSTSSLSSSTDGMSLRRRKKKAPAPPPPAGAVNNTVETESPAKTPSQTPKKKRVAPTPPTSTPKPSSNSQDFAPSLYITASDILASDDQQSTSETNESIGTFDSSTENISVASHPLRRLIPLEECLVEEGTHSHQPETEEVTYRRKIVPLSSTATAGDNFEHLERSKDNKEAQNRQRQSQASIISASSDSMPYLNKSSHGKWKRRKGPAPGLPGYAQPQRRILQMLPLQEIRQELEVIEVQQQGLEKQGVMLEKMIRERCEGSGDNRTTEELLEALPTTKNPKEVEELILQLFELVNEKNELFRRQAELMYLRRAHRLEEEQADVEYEIRTLMAQPEQNKTDSDKAKEEALIARLVEIVQLRNEVVDTLDRDRLREAEEDLSIKQRMESHTAKLDQDYLNQTPTKLSKKEKKKLKEAKKLKNKKLDADKDLDTSEMKPETSEKKKKKKKFLF